MIACHIVLLLSKIHVNKEFIRADNNCEAVLTLGNKLIWTLHSLCQSHYNRDILRESRDAIIRKRSKKGEVHPLTPTVRDVPQLLNTPWLLNILTDASMIFFLCVIESF